MTRVLLIPADGNASVRLVDCLDLPTLRRLLDGGYCEAVRLADSTWTAYCDEEGKLKGLPFNAVASALAWSLGWPPHDSLVGPVVWVGAPDDEGDDTDVPPEVVAAVTRVLRAALEEAWEAL